MNTNVIKYVLQKTMNDYRPNEWKDECPFPKFLMFHIFDTRSLCKAFSSSQSATNQDLVKWAEQEDNRAIKETGLKDHSNTSFSVLV